MPEQDYVLGTHDAEVERLGVQHRAWRHRVLDAWRRAGITTGHHVVDVGCGPGYASLDLSEIVGASGRVISLERSERFLAVLRRRIADRHIANIAAEQVDLVADDWGVSDADGAWCRWVLAFVENPPLVVRRIADSLKSGGRAIFHEYFDYATWRLAPRSEPFEEFVQLVIRNWRETGGEPDIGLHLPVLLSEAGLRVMSAEPVLYALRPDDFMWHWPESFVRVHLAHLAETGRVTREWARHVQTAYEGAGSRPGAFVVTPAVLEIIAEKL
jgi:SAM-dependent methyltransferase